MRTLATEPKRIATDAAPEKAMLRLDAKRNAATKLHDKRWR